MAKNGLLAAWLRDARSMEKALADFADKAIKDFEGNAGVQDELRAFVERSQQAQAEMDTSLDDLGESASGAKDLLGKLTGFIAGIGSSAYKDDKVKDMLVLHGAFHFAHASYKSLSQAATICGNETLGILCGRLAHEREEMANWASEMIPDVTEEVLTSVD